VRFYASLAHDRSFANDFAAIVPLYNGETAPKALRGRLLVLYQLQIIIGYAFVLSDASGYPILTLYVVFLSAT
jgi:hypothetical protein